MTTVASPNIEQLRKLILEKMAEHHTVYYVWNHVKRALSSATDEVIIEAAQQMMDADEICVANDEEDGIAFYRCAQDGEDTDLEAIYITDATEAFAAAQRAWDSHWEQKTEAQTDLLNALRSFAFGPSLRVAELLEVFRSLGGVEEWWPVFEELSAKRKFGFARHQSGELFIELKDGWEIESVHRRHGLPELKTAIEATATGHAPT